MDLGWRQLQGMIKSIIDTAEPCTQAFKKPLETMLQIVQGELRGRAEMGGPEVAATSTHHTPTQSTRYTGPESTAERRGALSPDLPCGPNGLPATAGQETPEVATTPSKSTTERSPPKPTGPEAGARRSKSTTERSPPKPTGPEAGARRSRRAATRSLPLKPPPGQNQTRQSTKRSRVTDDAIPSVKKATKGKVGPRAPRNGQSLPACGEENVRPQHDWCREHELMAEFERDDPLPFERFPVS
jgi:hypothetical protein